MGLSTLGLKTVVVVEVVSRLLLVDGTDNGGAAAHSKCMLPVLFDLLRIELVQRLQRELEVGEQCVATRLGKVLAHNHTQHLHLLRMRRHCVGGDDPSTLAELMSTTLD
jgi:hypothetical protein